MKKKQEVIETFNALKQVPFLPESLQRILLKIEDEESSANEIAKLVQYDQSISAAVLKLVNSVHYHSSQTVIGDIKQAVPRLGLEELRKICCSFWVMKYFLKSSEFINLKAYWRHNIAVALCTKVISKRLGENSIHQRHTFAAGLFHDIGILLLDQYFPREYRTIRRMARQKKMNMSAAEKHVLGLSHGEVGALLMQRWNFPAFLRNAAAFHHHPDECPKEDRLFCRIVHITDFVVACRGELEPGANWLEGFCESTWDHLRINVNQVPAIIKEIDREIENADVFTSLGLR